MIATAAATCIVSACATASSGEPAAASSATVIVATPAGAATAGSATAGSATAGAATAGAATVAAPTAGGATATLVPVTSSPSPTGPPTSATVIPAGPVTRADDGKTFQLAVGQQVTVVLAASPMMWDQPTAQGSAVTRVSASGGYPGTAPAQAVFRAVAPGTAQLTSATDMRCLHATPRCSVPQEIWSVTVVVT